jgi:hypothetical protein
LLFWAGIIEWHGLIAWAELDFKGRKRFSPCAELALFTGPILNGLTKIFQFTEEALAMPNFLLGTPKFAFARASHNHSNRRNLSNRRSVLAAILTEPGQAAHR